MLQRVLRPDDFNVRVGAHDNHYYYHHHYHYAGAHDDDHHHHDRVTSYLLRSATCM